MKSAVELITIIIATIFMLSCSTKPEIQVQTYGVITEKNKDIIVTIDPNNYVSFDQLINRVEQIVCNDSIPTISVYNKNVEKQIGLANPCWEGVGCILIRRRNVLKIQDEKIKINETVELDSLGEYISKHYNNYGKSHFLSENPRKARISITYKDLPISGLKTLTKKIIEFYEIQKIETPLILTLDRLIPPPPPPKNDEYKMNKRK